MGARYAIHLSLAGIYCAVAAMNVPTQQSVPDRAEQDAEEMFRWLSFRYPFRKYQRMVLAQIESGRGDHKYHIVAPPGSGKTIIGLELIRRFGAPAVVFVPTTTIQQQWREQVGMFTEDPAEVAGLTSLDAGRLAPINVFTYQLISTPGQAREQAQAIALEGWI